MIDTPCPCGSGRALDRCCGPYLEGAAQAPTAEALMRSRYTAHVKLAAGYLNRTQRSDRLPPFDAAEMARAANNIRWTGLRVLGTTAGGPEDTQGEVEFQAAFEQHGQPGAHHERSRFERHGGRWFYTKGTVIQEPARRGAPRVGRNEPCPCGSGKKYKKCCARR